jgi:uncharacterized membrane protein
MGPRLRRDDAKAVKSSDGWYYIEAIEACPDVIAEALSKRRASLKPV